MAHRIALVGGTGPEGRGLGARFALAGHDVILGSRDAARAGAVADELNTLLADAGRDVRVRGAANEAAVADAGIAVIVVPYEAQRPTLEGLAGALAGKVVVDAVVPVRFERGARPVEVAEGSATEQAAAILGDSIVIGAFHNLGAEALLTLDEPVDADVLVTGADADAKALVMALAEQVAGVRAVDAGPLRFSRFVEGLTVLLIGINGRYRAHTALRVTGLPAGGAS
ncbi:MAG: NADPH-dependent F420 reductase [Dehalococcoidia bacterium]